MKAVISYRRHGKNQLEACSTSDRNKTRTVINRRIVVKQSIWRINVAVNSYHSRRHSNTDLGACPTNDGAQNNKHAYLCDAVQSCSDLYLRKSLYRI
jgi:hypothetical protein